MNLNQMMLHDKSARNSLPREKIEKYGASALTNEELLALILGSGNQDCNVFELSRHLADFLHILHAASGLPRTFGTVYSERQVESDHGSGRFDVAAFVFEVRGTGTLGGGDLEFGQLRHPGA